MGMIDSGSCQIFPESKKMTDLGFGASEVEERKQTLLEPDNLP